ncbi:unnamed protein product [Sympodiomycopsis kandeliae]
MSSWQIGSRCLWRAGRRRCPPVSRLVRPAALPSLKTSHGSQTFSTSARLWNEEQKTTDTVNDEPENSHRAIGKSQGLFLSMPESPGTPFVLPHGVRLARKMERVIRDLYDVHGYNEVISPQLYKKDLWIRSGHWDNYRDDMFAVEGFSESEQREANKVMEQRNGQCSAHGHDCSSSSSLDDTAFGLKPMNCPGHCLMFASSPKTIKDLPIRFAEFSPLHRNEASGALSGLTRVRRFHQDDAHVFCAASQVQSEIETMLVMLQNAYNLFGFPQFELALSTRPDNYIGSLSEWSHAEQQLKDALESSKLRWTMNEGDGAFYGPKIDVRLIDAMGRKHQTATIQLDFQLPQRFDLKYQNPLPDNPENTERPVMIHRAILGSVERFMAISIESKKGNWPFWINPRQAIVIPTSDKDDKLLEYAQQVQTHLSLGSEFISYHQHLHKKDTSVHPPPRPNQVFHVDLDLSEERFSKKIRNASTVSKYSFALVVGQEELETGTVNVRYRVPPQPQPAQEPKPKSKKQLLKEKKKRQELGLSEDDVMPSADTASSPSLLEDHRQIRLNQAQLQDSLSQQDIGKWKVQDLRELFEKMDRWHL